MAEPYLAVSDLSIGYAKKAVAKGISFSLAPSEILALIGPNGAGKSTLIHTLLGAIPPISGVIQRGANLTQMAFVPQAEIPIYDFTVRQMVLMGRLPHHHGFAETAEDIAKAEQAMEWAGCAHLQDRVVTQLSGGERQKVLFARAWAQQPQVACLDEPNAHLDPGVQRTLEERVQSWAADGVGVVAAIHDLSMALRWKARVLLIHQGTACLAPDLNELIETRALDQAYGVRFARHLVDGHPQLIIE